MTFNGLFMMTFTIFSEKFESVNDLIPNDSRKLNRI